METSLEMAWGTGQERLAFQVNPWERIDISEQLNDAIQVNFSLALSGSCISSGSEVEEEIGDKETGLECLTLVQVGGQGLIRDVAGGMESVDVGWMVWKDIEREIRGLDAS